MKLIAIAGFIVALLGGAAHLTAQDMPQMPAPVKEHQWLQQFVGEWETEVEITMAPDQPPMKGKGTESTRALGGFWIIGEGKGEMEGMPGTMTSVLTLGYDPSSQKYTGTWVDSMTSYLWKYEGTVDPTGKSSPSTPKVPAP